MPQRIGFSRAGNRLRYGLRGFYGQIDVRGQSDRDLFESFQHVQRTAQPVDCVDAFVHMRAMGRTAVGFYLNPEEPLFAESHDTW